jgi:hypothetical protein
MSNMNNPFNPIDLRELQDEGTDSDRAVKVSRFAGVEVIEGEEDSADEKVKETPGSKIEPILPTEGIEDTPGPAPEPQADPIIQVEDKILDKAEKIPTSEDIDRAIKDAIRRQTEILKKEVQFKLMDLGFKWSYIQSKEITDRIAEALRQEITDETPKAKEQKAQDKGRVRYWRDRAIAAVLVGAGVLGVYYGAKPLRDWAEKGPSPKQTQAAKSELGSKVKSEAKKHIEIVQLGSQKIQIDRESGADCVWEAIKIQIVPKIIKGANWQHGVISKEALLTDAIKDGWVLYCHEHGLNPNLVYNGSTVSLDKFLDKDTQAELDRINNSTSLHGYLEGVDHAVAQTKSIEENVKEDAKKAGINISFAHRPALAHALARKPASHEARALNAHISKVTKPVKVTYNPAGISAPIAEKVEPSGITAPIAQEAAGITAPAAQVAPSGGLQAPVAEPTNDITSPAAEPSNNIPAPEAQPLVKDQFVSPKITAPAAQAYSPDFGGWDYGTTKKKKKPNEF